MAPIFFHKPEEKPYGFFCQWYLAPFTFEGQEFNCAEQFFMWKKAKHFGDEDSARCILREKSPKKQKALGRGVRGFDEKEWDKVKVDACEQASMLKYTQCVTRWDDAAGQGVPLKKLLLDTGDRELFEASPFDRIWGIGVKADIAQQNGTSRRSWGQNLLGQCLMKTRERIRAQEAQGAVGKS